MENLEHDKYVIEEDLIKMLMSYYDEITAYLMAFDIGEENVKDAVQETFLKAYVNLGKLQDETKLKFWLLKIAKRTGIKYEKKQNKKANFETSLIEIQVDTPDDNDIELKDMISKLSEREQYVIVLHFLLGYKFKEIAKMLGESDSNARSISKRAMDKLRIMAMSEKNK